MNIKESAEITDAEKTDIQICKTLQYCWWCFMKYTSSQSSSGIHFYSFSQIPAYTTRPHCINVLNRMPISLTFPSSSWLRWGAVDGYMHSWFTRQLCWSGLGCSNAITSMRNFHWMVRWLMEYIN